jgi:hypothetical protein
MEVDEGGHNYAKELSRNALREILTPETNAQAKGKTMVLQAIDVKIFTEADNKKNIR